MWNKLKKFNSFIFTRENYNYIDIQHSLYMYFFYFFFFVNEIETLTIKYILTRIISQEKKQICICNSVFENLIVKTELNF